MERLDRKILNCIVDDSALAAGVKKSTRDGIRKWLNAGAIRLFVPLYTLERLNALKLAKDRRATDAHEAIDWLDEVTSETGCSVHIQAPDQAYEKWSEVEAFMLPETLLSIQDVEDYAEYPGPDESESASMSSSQSLDMRPRTPSSSRSVSSTTSPDNSYSSPKNLASDHMAKSPNRTARNSSEMRRPEPKTKGAIPPALKDFFNHSVWLINQEPYSETALASFILLSNDPTKQAVAQRFGLRTKRLEQLREIVAREERELKNRASLYRSENKTQTATHNSPAKLLGKLSLSNLVAPKSKGPKSDDEDIVVFKRNSRGSSASLHKTQQMLDPNDFSRASQNVTPRGSSRGGRGSNRGTPSTPRGPSHYVAPAMKASPRARVTPTKPIDPDSFERPNVGGSARGGRRRPQLWEPA